MDIKTTRRRGLQLALGGVALGLTGVGLYALGLGWGRMIFAAGSFVGFVGMMVHAVVVVRSLTDRDV